MDVVGCVMKCVEMGVEGVGWEVCLFVSEGWFWCWYGFCEVWGWCCGIDEGGGFVVSKVCRWSD